MKKYLIAIALVSLTFTACTDNTAEHEELSKEIQNIEKEESIHEGGNGDSPGGNDED
ncbi:exported hypothetical protein [Tenacibaculum sp. 190524A02b]|uniref:Lipoprotein n=1 Tax=Tenacibaculum vairaonense TaxID=3137860 RepID=A0ABM9PLT9_9FLAO